MELLNDDDETIKYHLGNTNVVVVTLSQKTVSMGSLAHLSGTKWLLSEEIQTLGLCLYSWEFLKVVGC